jgi:hypothetical protein
MTGYKIIKQEYTSDTDTYTESKSDFTQEGGANKYNSIVNTGYKKPKQGTFQDNLTKEDIQKKLIGYKSLKTMSQKKYLQTLVPFKAWVRYYNPITKQFRTGGLLMKVDPDMRFIMLVNTSKNLTWSVQLKDNIIFVPDPKIQEEKETEQNLKEKLLDLYKNGKLMATTTTTTKKK